MELLRLYRTLTIAGLLADGFDRQRETRLRRYDAVSVVQLGCTPSDARNEHHPDDNGGYDPHAGGEASAGGAGAASPYVQRDPALRSRRFSDPR